jgi:hypothetical protein
MGLGGCRKRHGSRAQRPWRKKVHGVVDGLTSFNLLCGRFSRLDPCDLSFTEYPAPLIDACAAPKEAAPVSAAPESATFEEATPEADFRVTLFDRGRCIFGPLVPAPPLLDEGSTGRQSLLLSELAASSRSAPK